MMKKIIPATLTFEHILALTIENTCPHLQILALQELCNSNCCGVRGARINGLLLLLLLLLGLLLSLLLCHGLLLHLCDKLRYCHSRLFCIDGNLSLYVGDLFWG